MGLMLIACTDPAITKIRSKVEPGILASLEYPESYEFGSVFFVDTLPSGDSEIMEQLQNLINQYPEDDSYKMALQEIQLRPESPLVSYKLEYKAKSKLGEVQKHTYNGYTSID